MAVIYATHSLFATQAACTSSQQANSGQVTESIVTSRWLKQVAKSLVTSRWLKPTNNPLPSPCLRVYAVKSLTALLLTRDSRPVTRAGGAR